MKQVILALLSFIALGVQAASLYGIDSSNQRRQQLQDQVRTEKLQAEKSLQHSISATHFVLPDKENPCYVIKKITLIDYDNSHSSRFQSFLKSAFNTLQLRLPHCMGAQSINVLMQQLQHQLIKQGWITTRVIAGAQNLQSGELVLTVISGNIRHIVVQDKSPYARFTPITAATGLVTKSGRPLNLREIEQSLDNFRRVPSVDAQIEIYPADTLGMSDLHLNYTQYLPYRLTLGLDDSGSTATGKFLGSATLFIDNPFSANDLFYASVTHRLATNNDDTGDRSTHNLSWHYSVPVGYWLFSLDQSHYKYDQTVFGAFENYRYAGKSYTSTANVAYTLYRDNQHKISLWGSVWLRKSDSFINDEKIDVQHRRTAGYQVGIKQHSYWGNTSLALGLRFKRGTGVFNTQSAPEELFNEGTSRFKLLLANVSLNVPFHLGRNIFQYNVKANGQYNFTPLLPQDRFSIGGRYTVRGFDGEMTLLGDKGFTLQNTLAWLYSANRQHQAYCGVDYGKVFSQPLYSQGRQLAGSVIGLKGYQWGLNYDVFVGKPLHKPRGFQTPNTVAGFSLEYQF